MRFGVAIVDKSVDEYLNGFVGAIGEQHFIGRNFEEGGASVWRTLV